MNAGCSIAHVVWKSDKLSFFSFCSSWKMKKIIQNHCTLLASSQEVTYWLLTSCHRICIVWCQRSDPTQIRDYVFVSKQRTQRVLTGCNIKIYFCTGKHLQRENPDLFVQKQTLWHFEQISGAQNEDKTCASSQPDVFCIMGQTIVWRSRISTGPLFRIVTLYNKALKSVASIAHLNNELLKKWASCPIVQIYNICTKSFASFTQIHTDCTIY